MKIKIILVIAMLLLTLSVKSQILTPITYIEKYDSLATNLMNEHGIPASIILGISMLESGYGNSKLSTNKNNYFGVRTGKYYKDVWKEFPSDWFDGLDVEKDVTSIKVLKDVNKYKVKQIKAGDRIIVTGCVGDHGTTIAIERYNIKVKSNLITEEL